jgi:hypothetical protein
VAHWVLNLYGRRVLRADDVVVVTDDGVPGPEDMSVEDSIEESSEAVEKESGWREDRAGSDMVGAWLRDGF